MDTWEKVKKAAKNKHNWVLLVIVLIGAILIAFPTGKKTIEGSKKEKAAESTAQKADESTLESRLSSILGKVEGAGDVSVMITYASSSEKSLAYDTVEETNRGTDSQDKLQKEAVVSDGNPVILKEDYPAIQGVIVVAQGAGDSKVQLNIINAVKTVLGIDSYQVTVLKKGI